MAGKIYEINFEDPLVLLKNCGGYYESPKDSDGRYLGPVVAYAGKYAGLDGEQKHKVGFNYYNFAKAEEIPAVRKYFSEKIAQPVLADRILPKPDAVLGAPMGGIVLSVEIGNYFNCRTIFAEKKVIEPADNAKGLKERSRLIVDRHEIYKGDNVALVEDVCNNFSTTEELLKLIESLGGKLIYIFCAVNRSGRKEWNGIPVFSAIYQEAKNYKQEDQEVREHVKAGNIVWKPKHDWPRLKAAMNR